MCPILQAMVLEEVFPSEKYWITNVKRLQKQLKQK